MHDNSNYSIISLHLLTHSLFLESSDTADCYMVMTIIITITEFQQATTPSEVITLCIRSYASFQSNFNYLHTLCKQAYMHYGAN